MKKMLAVLAVAAAVVAFVGVSHAFDVPGVTKSAPTSVGDVAKEPANFEYDQCKSYAEKYNNSADVNSRTLPDVLKKDLGTPTKTITDNRKDKSDKYGNWEAEYKYGKMGAVTLKASCDYKKCNSVYCNKK